MALEAAIAVIGGIIQIGTGIGQAANAAQQTRVTEEKQQLADELQFDAATINVEAIEDQIENRKGVLADQLSDYNAQSKQIQGNQQATVGASGAAIMPAGRGSVSLVEQQVEATRTEVASRLQEQAGFDVEQLELDKQKEVDIRDAYDPANQPVEESKEQEAPLFENSDEERTIEPEAETESHPWAEGGAARVKTEQAAAAQKLKKVQQQQVGKAASDPDDWEWQGL